jgi:hypothetical protein
MVFEVYYHNRYFRVALATIYVSKRTFSAL